mgnify:CR=1 FL=1
MEATARRALETASFCDLSAAALRSYVMADQLDFDFDKAATMFSALQDALRDGASLAVSSAVNLKLIRREMHLHGSRLPDDVKRACRTSSTRLSSAQKPRKPSRIIGLLPDPLRRRHSNAVRPPPGTSTFVRRPSVDVPRRAQGQQSRTWTRTWSCFSPLRQRRPPGRPSSAVLCPQPLLQMTWRR